MFNSGRMKVLVTGAAGFIGSQVMLALARRGEQVLGLDNLDDYYDICLKHARLNLLKDFDNCSFLQMSIEDESALMNLFATEHFDCVINLAAQAGARHSVNHPRAYLNSNIIGFFNVLEACRKYDVGHLIFASSSSVYGNSNEGLLAENADTDSPVSFYAATKKADELMAYSYSQVYGMRVTGVRFFTVYGPWGRPDMAPMLFAKSILEGSPIRLFNGGDMLRDFTYIDDVVEGVLRLVDSKNSAMKDGCCSVFNIGCSNPVRITDFISEMEVVLERKAVIENAPMQKGDVYATFADVSKIESLLHFRPKVNLKDGINEFIKWYLSDENPLK